ncbi:Elongation factor G [Posidoniimonas corsicana]|uniref:Elongation factor G n=1 Tax=Posidoniimonas corsicana TaxID=1938618 RepID=A0A5C5V5B9_9BACT|nr:elongation factor G [Posidoniimonas corsicana]TWT33726.1 Elongation factor G [Posidoniimonas corsicana]
MAINVENVRNIAVCGHGSSGKTSLVDALLVKSGAVSGRPSVDDGTSICDFDEEEKHHKHSVEATLTHFEHAGKWFNVLDTPGYPDLIGQTISALRGVDTALITIDAHAGIKVNTRRVWEEAGKAGLARILCITKLDDHNVDFQGLLDSIHETFGQGCVLFDAPDGTGDGFHEVIGSLDPVHGESTVVDLAAVHETAVETIIEVDEEVMEKYFEGEEPDHEKLARLAVEAEKQGTVTPIVCVSVKNDIGVKELMDMLAEEAFSPCEMPHKARKEGDEVTLKADPSAPLAAQVFRTRVDPFVQKLSFIRVYSGTLKRDSVVPSAEAPKGVKLGALLRVQADKTEPVDEAGPGDIVAVAKCDDLHTGMSLGEVELPPINFPTAMIGLAVSPKNHGDEAKLSTALHKLVEEDPTIHVEHDPETKETVLTGMSELHLNLVRERVARRDHVEIETHEPKIPYRETITSNGEGSYRHKKQSGGAGQFAEVHIRMYPLPEGADPDEYATKDRFPQLKHTHYHAKHHFLWVDTVVGGAIPGNFMPAIEKGFLERIGQGVIAGCPVQNVCVEVHFGKDHPVDSNETAFKMAASKAFAEVFKQSRPALMEPFVKLEITVPADNVGDVSSDLSGRRGQMLGMDQAPGGLTVITAKAPLAEVMTYARTLGSMTGGQGSYTMEFAAYEPVPGHVQQEVIAKAKVRDDDD